MDEEQLDGIRDAHARWEILKLVRTRHRAQQSRMDHVELWHMLRALGFDLGEYNVLTYLQDLEASDLLEFDTTHDRKYNRLSISKIRLRSRGLAVLERRVTDDTVLM